jgi:hypothetical protein
MDPFHSVYRELSDEEKALMVDVKDKALALYQTFDKILAVRNPDAVASTPLKSGREVALARTQLEDSVMWAVKGLTV